MVTGPGIRLVPDERAGGRGTSSCAHRFGLLRNDSRKCPVKARRLCVLHGVTAARLILDQSVLVRVHVEEHQSPKRTTPGPEEEKRFATAGQTETLRRSSGTRVETPPQEQGRKGRNLNHVG